MFAVRRLRNTMASMTEMNVDQALVIARELHMTGRLNEAVDVYQQILQRYPEHAEAWHMRGVAISQLGQPADGLQSIDRAIQLAPAVAQYQVNRAVVLAQLGRIDEAIGSLRQAIARQGGQGGSGDTAETHYNLAHLLDRQGNLEEAFAEYRRALDLKSDYAQAWNGLGSALKKKGEIDGAIAAFRQATVLQPQYVDAFNRLAKTLDEADRVEEAIAAYERAAQLQPGSAEAQGALGNIYHRAGRFEDAIKAFNAALKLRPGYAEALYSIGNVQKDQGKLDEAIATFDQAVAARGSYPEAQWNRALTLLLKGDFENGWKAYESRWTDQARLLPKPLWDGNDLEGKRILLRLEQGLGDIIHFIRYAPMVAERGGKVVVQCPRPLKRLLEGQCDIETVVSFEEQVPDYDVHYPLLSLPALFGTTLQTIPNDVPYLLADATLAQTWADRMSAEPDGLKVGIAWAGNPEYVHDRQRTISPAALKPLTEAENVRFYSLQKGPQLLRGKATVPIPMVDWADDLKDFADTAALITNLDLVIACDTAVAHLAGAMGRTVWTLLPYSPDWRWMLGRGDSPWYPTMRLFRQPKVGDWGAVIEEVKGELMKQRGSGV